MKRRVGALLLSFGGLVTCHANAATPAERCVAESDEGQLLRDHGVLLRAREKLAACAQEECPAIVRKACAEWLEGVDARLPSVVVTVRDERGKTIAADVLVDGAPFAGALGTATPMDPGFHVVQARVPGRPVAESKIQVHEREKNVAVPLVVLDAAPSAPQRRSARKVPLASWIFGGAAIGAGVASIVFWRDAVSKGDDLKGSCAPGCNDDEVAPVERSLLVSRVAGGVAVGAAAAAVLWFVLAPARDPDDAPVRATGSGLSIRF